jgi:TorA maturation chaperone TorD
MMTMQTESAVLLSPPLEPEEQSRAALYGLLARLLYAAPDQDLLHAIAQADDMAAYAPQALLGQAWRALQLASQVADEDALTDEFEQLFIGLGQGEVVPYMSWHLTGFLMEEPLARLRNDLADLGLARLEAVSEPEDHMAAILEVMRFLIVGDDDTPAASLKQQRHFFDAHLRPWYVLYAAQVEVAPSANYYRLVARILRAFMDVEAQSFEID